MDYIVKGFYDAFRIIIHFNKDFTDVVARSLLVSLTATLLAALIAVPLFILIGGVKLAGEGVISRILNSFMSLPSVTVGLLVLLFLSRRGPLGGLGLLFSVKAMIIAQLIYIFPLLSAMTYETAKTSGRGIKKLGQTLGAGRLRIVFLTFRELKDVFFIYVITAFSKAISEVGAVMMVGGNIKGKTAVMTTTISMYNSMGEYELAIALGIILVLISCVINWIAYSLKEKGLKYGG